MDFILFSTAVGASFFAGSLALLSYGRRLGRRHVARAGANPMAGLDAVEGAVFALLGLLLAFAVSGALQRFDERRQLIVQETSAIVTAYDRLDLLDAASRDALKAKLKSYLKARVDLYRQPIDFEVDDGVIFSQAQETKIAALKAELWSGVVAACPAAAYGATCSILLPTVASVFEAALLRRGANDKHPPEIVFVMLYGLGLVGSLLAGFGMAAAERPSRIHILAFAMALSFALYVVTDAEFPRLGLIRADAFDHLLLDAHAKMN